MKTRKFTILLVAALSVLAIAGVKVSQLTRTRSLQSTSRFLVSTQDASSGRWSSRYITADDLGTNLSQWLTNSGTGTVTATNAVTETNANQFLGVPLAIRSGSTETNKQLYPASISASAVTINGLQFQSADLLKAKDYLGNDMFTIGADGALLVNGNITAAAGDLSSSGNMTIGGTADITGSATFGSNVRADGELQLGNKRIKITIGNGSPEGVVAANPQSIYLNTNQTAGIGLYLKTNGTSSAGWWLLTGDITRSEYNTDIGNLQAATNSHNTRITAIETGVSGTNQPVTLSAGTLTLITSQTARYYTNTGASFPFSFSGTANASAIVTLAVSNTAASIIYITNSSGVYDPTVASNVSTFAIAPESQRNFRFIRNATSGWELDGTIGKEYELVPGGTTTFQTNGAQISIITAPNTNNTSLQITNRLTFGATNIVVTNTSSVLLDLSQFTIFRVALLTNANFVFTNQGAGLQRAQVIVQQDTNGQRTTAWTVAGGLIQTNASLQVTTNASAVDLLEVATSYYTSNLLAWWPQNFQPRVAFTNTLFNPASAVFTDSFEETDSGGAIPSSTDGYDSLLISAETGTPNADATDRNIGDTGAQSLKLDATSTTQVSRWTVSSQTAVYVKLKIQIDALPSTTTAFNLLSLRDGSGNIQGRFAIQTDGKLRCLNGTSTATTVDAMAADTTYYVWYYWDTAGNAELAFSTTDSRPTSGNAYQSITGGNGTTAITRVQLSTESGNALVGWFDDLKVYTGGYP